VVYDSKVVVAFLLSPLASTLFLAIWSALSIGRQQGHGAQAIGVLVLLYGTFCYVATLVLGVPLFFAYRRFHITSSISYAVGGAGIGLVFCAILLYTGYGSGQVTTGRIPDLGACAIAGALAGLAFRWMVEWRKGASLRRH